MGRAYSHANDFEQPELFVNFSAMPDQLDEI